MLSLNNSAHSLRLTATSPALIFCAVWQRILPTHRSINVKGEAFHEEAALCGTGDGPQDGAPGLINGHGGEIKFTPGCGLP